MNLSLDITGVAEVQRNLARVLAHVVHTAPLAVHEEGNRIMGKSVTLVPVDTGLLRSTAHVEVTVPTPPMVTVELRYGNHGLANYAAKIELDTSLNHPNGGQSHYLQEPFFAAVSSMAERLATTLRTGMR